jgi:hypothetical protein
LLHRALDQKEFVLAQIMRHRNATQAGGLDAQFIGRCVSSSRNEHNLKSAMHNAPA